MRVTALLKHLLFQCTSYHHYIKIHANKSAGVNTLTDLSLSSQSKYEREAIDFLEEYDPLTEATASLSIIVLLAKEEEPLIRLHTYFNFHHLSIENPSQANSVSRIERK